MSIMHHSVGRAAALIAIASVLVGLAGLAGCGLDLAASGTPFSDGGSDSPASGSDARASADGPTDIDLGRLDGGKGDADAASGPEPLSVLSPYHPSGTLTYQKAIDWTIATADSAALILYTIDGTTPGAPSPTAVGKVTLAAVPDNTTIRWVVAPSTNVHAFLVRVNPALSSSTATFADRVVFGATGAPIAKVAPGATLNGTARAFAWNGSVGCPNCIDQLLIGVVVAEDCLTDDNPHTYPGATTAAAPFSVKAPSTPGIYRVKTGFTQQLNCRPDAIGKSLGQTEVATIIVE